MFREKDEWREEWWDLFDLTISYEYGRYTENLKDQILFFLGTQNTTRRDRETDLAYIAQQRRFRARYLISEFSRRRQVCDRS